MENKVLSIDQMQHLKELGVDTSKASIYWARRSHGSRIDDSSKGDWFLSLQKEFMGVGFTAYEVVPTFTLQDIIHILPTVINNGVDFYTMCIETSQGNWVIYYYRFDAKELVSIDKENLICAAYEMLVWCVENGYVKTNNRTE